MNEEHHAYKAAQTRAERQLLRALADANIDRGLGETIFARLKLHRFADPDHEVIFRALAGMPEIGLSDAQAALLQAMTRLGFPDVDLTMIFSERVPSEKEILSLLRSI